MRKANEFEIAMATAIIRAVDIRESSYNHKAADKARKEVELARIKYEKEYPNRIFYGGVDYAKFYTISLEEACEKAADEGPGIALGRLIYLSLEQWNETIDWAYQILDKTAITVPTLKHCQHGNVFTINQDNEEDQSCRLCDAFWKQIHKNDD